MNAFIKKIGTGYRSIITLGSWLQPVLLLIIRLYWGWQFYLTGSGKLKNLEQVTEFFTGLGIPLPGFSAALVATTECVCGLLLLVGLASRLASIPLIIVLIVAYSTDDKEALFSIFSDTDKFFAATPFLFLFAVVLIFAFGPGVFSIDYIIKRIINRKSANAGQTGSVK